MSMNERAGSGRNLGAAFLLLIALGALGGWIWGRGAPNALRAADPAGAADTPPAPAPKPPMHDWPTPAVALVLSGEMHGYVEPCGCTAGQVGGLARRATLVKGLRAQRGWPVVGFDLGGLMDHNRVEREQTALKFDMARTALEAMQFVSVGLGKEEALLRQDGLLTSSEDDKQKPDFHLRYLSANVRPYPGQGLEIADLFRIINAPAVGGAPRGVRVAVTSVLGKSMSEGILNDDFFQIMPPAEALREVLPQMQAAQPDLLVLLSFCKTEESKELAEKFPEFGLVVSAGGPTDPDYRPYAVGRTMFLHVGHKGKNVGVVGFYPQAPADQRLKYELVPMDGRKFANAPEIDDLMQAYQDRLRDERPDLVDNAQPSLHPSGRKFVGAETCGECHTKAFAKWSTTGHAHALAGLTTGRPDHEGRWIDRKWDAECLACHVTGWNAQEAVRYESGFVDEMTTPHLANNQCENCHGPGSRHVELENGEGTDAERAAERETMKLKLEVAERRCRECHDTDNDPHFDGHFEEYWEKIAHPGKD
jgi:hypothetical protein